MSFLIKKGIISCCFVLMMASLMAQDKYFTKSGSIQFSSKGVIETIEASHRSVTCVLDSKTGDIQFAVLMKGFEFRKAMMQEHFNENYVESDKYPKSEFRGQIVNNSEIDYTKDGSYTAHIKGKLTLHGQTKDVEADGKITVKGGKLLAASKFKILMSDYDIDIPGSVTQNMSDTINISVNCTLELLQQ
ncbi:MULTISPECIES: YceI family protein [Niastella]|uniref:YceI family protein n=1 Tax=Niastella soli TaxID=2821487 RepID=A0ABS3YMU9_9BACT|nr:YceI family protein [Niastella soli]MBO9199219.1 YceI family protein [Niastella soli]